MTESKSESRNKSIGEPVSESMGEYKLNPQSVGWLDATNCLFLNDRLNKEICETILNRVKSLTPKKTGYLYLASSGSTATNQSSLKIVAISKKAFLTSAEMVQEKLGLSYKDCWLQVLPRYHVGGLGIEARSFVSGCSIEGPLSWEPQLISEHLKNSKATYLSVVPTQVFDLIKFKIKLPPTLKAIIVGGGYLNEELSQQAKSAGWKLLYSYGMTETSSMISLSDNKIIEAFPDILIKRSPEGKLGVWSPGLADFTLEEGSIKNILSSDGYYWTEDFVDEVQESNSEGLEDLSSHNKKYFLRGRGIDFVKINGEGVYLSDLRNTLDSILSKQGIRLGSMTLIVKNHERSESELILIYESHIKATVEEVLQEFNKNTLPVFKVSKSSEVNKIPKNELGKIQWGQLQDLHLIL